MSERHRREDGLPTIGLALIAKDEAETLPRLLESIGITTTQVDGNELDREVDHNLQAAPGIWLERAAVDFVVVVDTGSSDQTREVAAGYGCRVVDFEWIDDFSAARQASFDALPEDLDFSLWADCDDVIEGAGLLRQLAARMPAEISATIHRYDYAQDEAGNCVCELWRERLVRRGVPQRWSLPVHEVLNVDGGHVHSQEVVWHHRTPVDRERDPERNYKILRHDYDEAHRAGAEPSPRTLAYLGTEALALGRAAEAEDLFVEYLAREDAVWDQERCQVAHKLSLSRRAPREGEEHSGEAHLARLELSAQAAYEAIEQRPDWADGFIDLAEIALMREQPERALHFCETAQKLEPPQTLLIINPLEYSYQPELMRSIALAKLGRAEESFEATSRCLAVTPDRSDLLAQAAAIRAELTVARAEQLALELRELLVRHDENAKARILLDECVPYLAVNRPAIAMARLDQREMTLHATDPAVYGSYYRENPNEAPFERQGIEIAEADKTFHRVDFLRRGLDAQAGSAAAAKPGDGAADSAPYQGRRRELKILDLSANDGWMLKNLALSGYGVEGRLDGMDLNADAAARAQERLDPGATGKDLDESLAKRLPARIVRDDLHRADEYFDAGSYDAVVLFETIEHVQDPEATLELMARMAAPDGQLYLSTPDGAFERGNIPDWFRVESKGHLRALRAADVSSLIAPRGIVENFEVAQRLAVCAVTNEPRRARVDFFAGVAEAAPERILDEGLGGSETALCKVAEHLARRGVDARVFCGSETALRGDHITVGENVHDGGQVLYQPAAAWDPGAPADLFVSSRLPEAFDRTIAADRRALWLHDADYGDRLTPERVSRATDVLVLSEFQRELLAGRYEALREMPRSVEQLDPSDGSDWLPPATGLHVIRNGIEASFFAKAGGRRKRWVVYSSSPDRGLDVLLEVWPAVRERVPDAELHHTYAPVYGAFRDAFPHLAAFHRRLEKLAEPLEGVVGHGNMGQLDLARLFMRSRVWAYPSWSSALGDGSSAPFPEISCITAVEAQAAGAVPVCLDYGALPESVVAGELVPEIGAGPEGRKALSGEWRENFVDAIVRGLTDDEWAKRERKRGRKWALERDWSGVTDFFESLAGVPSRERERIPA